jgi:hypothetical protein
VKQKTIISSSNTKAIDFLKSLQDKKNQVKKHFAQPGSKLSSLKVNFDTPIKS